MSLVDRESTPARIAASQANGKKSQGPITPEGKARVSLNALKTGTYAKSERALREIMVRKGEDPDDFEQLHQGLTEEWQPEFVTEAMLVKTIAEKGFDKAQLRAAWMESQLNSLRVAEIQEQRRQLLRRRLRPGCISAPERRAPLWQANDSLAKFKEIFDILDEVQRWFDDREYSDMFPEAMQKLYGEDDHSEAGEMIQTLFIDLFGDDKEAAAKAEAELPKWIEQERSDVERERELYRREREIKAKPNWNLSEEQVAKKEAALEKQIREQTRLLLQLKAVRSQRCGPSDAAPAPERASSGQPAIPTAGATGPGTTESAAAPLEQKGAFEGAVAAQNEKMGQTTPTSPV